MFVSLFSLMMIGLSTGSSYIKEACETKRSCDYCYYGDFICFLPQIIRDYQMIHVSSNGKQRKNPKLLQLMAEECCHYQCKFREDESATSSK